MANTFNLVKDVYPYVLKSVSEEIGTPLYKLKIEIGDIGYNKLFDGVSKDKKTVLSISTSSGYSKTGKVPVGKINKVYLYCYMMNLTKADRKIIAFTNEEFHKIISKEKEKGLMPGIELLYIELTDELKQVVDVVSRAASDEM